jgi:sterol desaturase/sphingolipid hydroxylase (fatty acid hydroxylase superfamily)
VHHVIFKADETYQLIHEADKKTVPMAWWNGPALILLVQAALVPFSLWSGHFEFLIGSTAATVLYYAAYEYLHWCMHVPKARSVDRSGIFFRLNGHHLLHHRYTNKNFNVVLPLADLLFGTLLLRSPVRFGQARGPAVPDVQPIATGPEQGPVCRIKGA